MELLGNARRRAARRGEPFGLTREWVLERIKRGRCEATALPFDFSPSEHRCNPFAPSIDRKDSSGYYLPENCQVVVWIHNVARQDYGDFSVRRYARALNREATRATKTSTTGNN